MPIHYIWFSIKSNVLIRCLPANWLITGMLNCNMKTPIRGQMKQINKYVWQPSKTLPVGEYSHWEGDYLSWRSVRLYCLSYDPKTTCMVGVSKIRLAKQRVRKPEAKEVGKMPKWGEKKAGIRSKAQHRSPRPPQSNKDSDYVECKIEMDETLLRGMDTRNYFYSYSTLWAVMASPKLSNPNHYYFEK